MTDMTYTKCSWCPMFVEPNDVTEPGYAEFVHLMNDDRDIDVAYEASHEATPDLMIGAPTLGWWAVNGDAEWQTFDAYAKAWVTA